MNAPNTPPPFNPFDPMGILYRGERGKAVPIPNYAPPEQFGHWDKTLVADCPKTGSDGFNVRVYETRCPATFFEIEVLGTPNSMGEPREGIVIGTGSGWGMADLVGQLTKALNDGMLGFHSPPPRPLDDWHEDMGPVVWWRFPVEEPAWIGTPLDSDWPGYHTHWTPHPRVPEAPAAGGGNG